MLRLRHLRDISGIRSVGRADYALTLPDPVQGLTEVGWLPSRRESFLFLGLVIRHAYGDITTFSEYSYSTVHTAGIEPRTSQNWMEGEF